METFSLWGKSIFSNAMTKSPGACCLSCTRTCTCSYVSGLARRRVTAIREREERVWSGLRIGSMVQFVKSTTQPTPELGCSLPGNDRQFQTSYQTTYGLGLVDAQESRPSGVCGEKATLGGFIIIKLDQMDLKDQRSSESNHHVRE